MSGSSIPPIPLIPLSELLNAANWEYYQSLLQVPNGLTPLFNSNSVDASWQADGMNAEAFLVTGTNQIIVAFEGTNTDPASPTYNTAYAKGSLDLDILIAAGNKLPIPTPISAFPGLQDALSFMQSVKTYADAHDLTIAAVTGHSLGAAIASYVSYTDNYAGTGFAAPGLNFPTEKSGATFVNYADNGDPIGNYAGNGNTVENLIGLYTGVSHFGTTVQIGNAANGALFGATVGLIVDGGAQHTDAPKTDLDRYNSSAGDTLGIAAKIALNLIDHYHPITNYAADLGITLTNRTPPDAIGSSQLGQITGGGTMIGGIPIPATAGIAVSDVDATALSGIATTLGSAQLPPVASIYDGTDTTKTDMGFLQPFTGNGNIAVLDPDSTKTTVSGSTATTVALDPSGTYVVPAGYQAMIALGIYSYDMEHQAGGTAMRIVANAGIDTVRSAVSGDTVQAGTGYLVDIQESGALTFIGGSGNSTISGGTGSTLYFGGAGNDVVHAGTGGGSEICIGSGAVTVTGGGNGTVFGGAGSDLVFGGTGDVVVAGTGNTTLASGQGGSNWLGGGSATVFGAANSTVTGGSGTSMVVAGAGTEHFDAGSGNNTVFGGAGSLDIGLAGGASTVVLGSGTATLSAAAGHFTGGAAVFDFAASDSLSLSGYGSGQVTTTVQNGSTIISTPSATITLVGYTGPTALG